MPHVLVATDSAALAETVEAVLPVSRFTTTVLRSGAAVRTAAAERSVDLAIVDFQVGNMGGPAICFDLRLEESGGRLPHTPLLLLLDRRDDVFLARRSQAEGWVCKPLDPIRLRNAIDALLAGGRYEDSTGAPTPTVWPSFA